MWEKWTTFYNRAKSADDAYSLVSWALWGIKGIIALVAAVLAAASITWHWYWDTFSWAGVAFAFLLSWVFLSLGFLLTGLGAAQWRYFNPPSKQLAGSNDGHAATVIHQILKEKFVYGGSPSSPGKTIVFPSFQATFDKQDDNIRIFVDEIYFLPLPGPPVNWTTKNHLLLKEIQRVSRDETLSIRLLSQFDCKGQKLWRWGEGGAAEGQYLFLPNSIYQGRVRVVSAEQQECCYFIILGMESDDGPPRVIGEHLFNFPAKWDAEDEKNVEMSL